MPDMQKLPCNARIAVALLDVLASAGDTGARARALRAAGFEAGSLRVPGAWVSEDSLVAMFRAVPVDRKLARRVGHQLVTPDGLGLLLCYGGVATPEKAYRRSDQVLARECQGGSYEALEISDERAQIAFHPGPRATLARQRAPQDWEIELCGVREGMLEAVPMLFGLLPAVVRETQCVARGAGDCRFDVGWKRSPRQGLMAGAGFGVLAGLGFVLSFGSLASPWLLAPAVLGLVALCAVAGRSLDLARQLEAVAGARRGQLALLDQADRSLAEKMDELAKIGAALDSAAASSSGGSPPGVARREPVDLGEIVTRAVDGIRPSLAASLELDVELEADLPKVRCEPLQMEQVVDRLLRRAVEASEGRGRVRVHLHDTSAGPELVVEDEGGGMEQDELERSFDPFLGGAAGEGADAGLGLCCRVVEQHGGELRVATEEGGSTRVTVLLPPDFSSGAGPGAASPAPA